MQLTWNSRPTPPPPDIYNHFEQNVFKDAGGTLAENRKDLGTNPPSLAAIKLVDEYLALIMFYSIFPKHVMSAGKSFSSYENHTASQEYGGEKSQ